MKIYRIVMPGNGEFDFTKGQKHRTYGEVVDIKLSEMVSTTDGQENPLTYIQMIDIWFKDQCISVPVNSPLIVTYWEEETK